VLGDLEWTLFAILVGHEPVKRGHGIPRVSFRKVFNTLLYVFVTGCRWEIFRVAYNGRPKALSSAGRSAGLLPRVKPWSSGLLRTMA
jgi:transposase